MSILRDLDVLRCLTALSPMISRKSVAFPREARARSGSVPESAEHTTLILTNRRAELFVHRGQSAGGRSQCRSGGGPDGGVDIVDGGPMQAPAHLGIPQWKFQAAVHHGLIPKPTGGRWPAR
jgi:hypothetical protein